jgi:hypothetical protein
MEGVAGETYGFPAKIEIFFYETLIDINPNR